VYSFQFKLTPRYYFYDKPTDETYVGTAQDAALIEPRTNIFFVKGQPLLRRFNNNIKKIIFKRIRNLFDFSFLIRE